MDLKNIFADNLRIYRAKANLTRKKLAEMIGSTPDYISALEHGQDKVSISAVEKMAKAFGIEPSLLFRDPWKKED